MGYRALNNGLKSFWRCSLGLLLWQSSLTPSNAQSSPKPDKELECELLVVGGGLAGAAASYEALLAGKTVCMTEITDWVGGQISSQGTSALDERTTQREQLFYPRGYLELRDRIENFYGELNPGECWVSVSCFFPDDAHTILLEQLKDAEAEGQGKLHWLPNTVIKDLEITGRKITSAVAIQHQPQPGKPKLNTYPLSRTIEDAYTYEDSDLLKKEIIKLNPAATTTDWYVIEATETGEIVGLADVPYRLGIDALSHLEPSSSSLTNDPYCTQGFTYTFAMEATAEPQEHTMPSFYMQHHQYYSYELERLADFDLVFTYRRIWSPNTGEEANFRGVKFTEPTPGDISMQNWTWGNDYRPGTSKDNLVYTRRQLEFTGQLEPGGWLGGLRTETLQKGEDHALGYFYWLVEGTTDSQLGDGVKTPNPNHRLLVGLDSPMGTAHGLSKYPYMREGRRIIGRVYPGYSNGFTVTEIDISRRNYREEYYVNNLDEVTYRQLWTAIDGLEAVANKDMDIDRIVRRTRSTIYPDSIGIGHYAIDFHPCMNEYPAEKPGNTEREGERRGGGQAYPFQIPLRAMIPQKIDNLIVTGKSIATSHIAAAAYRVHSFEWSSGAAAGIITSYALENDIMIYELIDETYIREKELQSLQKMLNESGNPTAFPDTSIFNQDWEDWQ
ncbi:Fumarate reductase/succinate dehydrogenase flavoprotein domain protein [Hyella patelloides LEGE 07179]|uniref:Fumarate reductase/succinate dehydrogenase flavoprotein domain protein n=1 Tax=Hyella patelloides LEGE 07179 TaxID=945734 RepID=A0A563W3L9_9CYAN|nr:Fumarate reductase/succinate dehydrogenase flavoprotein domain protein [Hyella patelloides LEGE 07179]